MNQKKKVFHSDKHEVYFDVKEQHHGIRLDQFIMQQFANLSRQKIKKKIELSEIIIQGRKPPHRASVKVHMGETVYCVSYRKHLEDDMWDGEIIQANETPQIIFQNDAFLAISKPPFMATHPTGKHLFNCVTVYFQNQNIKVHTVHRIDRETSGILLLGKSPKWAAYFTEEFFQNRIRKCYFFIAVKKDDRKYTFPFWANERLAKVIVPDEIKINQNDENRLTVAAYPENSKEGKKSRTFFDSLYEDDLYLVGLAFPVTGRQHQIRAHANYHGLPLLGDKLYLGGASLFSRFKDHEASQDDHDLMQIPRQALHAMGIHFTFENQKKTIIDHIPQDLQIWMAQNLDCDLEQLNLKIKLKIENYFNSDDK